VSRLSEPATFGLATTLQELPFQCMVSVELSLTPTAQTSWPVIP
jgi:hypothetical protein